MTEDYIRPDVRAFLDYVAASPGPRTHEVDAATARIMSQKMRQFGDVESRPIAVRRDLQIPTDEGRSVAARFYDARDTRDRGPLIVFFHGGGFVFGDLDIYDAACTDIALGLDLPLLSIDYRLAPEHPWPAAIEDVVDVVRLIAGGGLGKAPRRIALMGVSAGAGLAAAATRRLAASGDNPVELLALLSPWLDLTLSSPSATLYGTGFFQELSQLADFADAYAPAGADRAHPEMSPARHPVTPGWPRTILLAAELDPLADDAALFARRLAEAQVPHDIRYARGMLHGFHTWWHRIDIEEDLAWLDDRLRAWAATG